MRLTSSGAYARQRPAPKMPPGLVELIEDLTRNVLRHNPTDIYEFCAGHMQRLLEIRDGRAAPKPVLTLEQKIARTQEKLHKKTELRRQKYDKQMQLYRSNIKLVQSPEQREQCESSTTEENKPPNSLETPSSKVADSTKETVHPEDNRSHLNNADDKPEESSEISPKQEIARKNIEEDIFANKEDTKTEQEETNTVQGHVNIVPEDKDSIEKPIEKDIEVENKSEESTTNDLMERKTNQSNLSEEIKNKSNDLTEKLTKHHHLTKQDIEIHTKEEESALSNIEEETVGYQTDEKQFVKDIEIENVTEDSVAVTVQDEMSNLDTAKVDSEDSTKATRQDVTEIKKDECDIRENFDTDKPVVTNAIEDKSKCPIHHEQDLVEDLEVEIFHESSETKKESKNVSSDAQATIDEVKHNSPIKHSSNFESDVSKLELTNGEGDEKSKETKDINSFDKHNMDRESSDSLKLEDRSNAEDNVPENIKTSIDNSATNNSNNAINLNISVPETVNADSKISALVKKNIAQINEVSERPSQLKIESIITTEVSGVDRKELDETRKIISEIVNIDSIDNIVNDKTNAPVENIENSAVVEDNIDKEHVDVSDKLHSDDGVFEVPMQKKEYALLLPGVDSDNKIEPIILEHKNGQLEDEMQENIANGAKPESVIDKNILDNIEKSGKDEKFAITIVTAVSDLKEPVVQVQESCDNISRPVEKDENVTHDHIKIKLIEDSDATTKVKETNAKIEDEDQKFGKESHDQKTEIKTTISGIEISNNNNKSEAETTKQDERSGNASDTEEIVSINEHTQNTDTQVINDSAENSSVGDSNESSMDHDAETVTRSKIPSTMDLETAAVTIQKVFRTFLFKSRCSTFDDTSNEEANPITDDDDNEKEEVEFPIAKERRTLGISRMDTVLQTVNEEKSLSLSTDDSSTLSSAATVIQAHVRGYLARNKYHSHKTTSLVDVPSTHSSEADDQQKKTVLNIHIVPEGDHFLSRDESIITSMDLSLDGSPPTSVNLHPLGYDKSEPRKQLKREDAIQSISPPSNNSGKLSEDVDSVKDIIVVNETAETNIARADTDVDSDISPTYNTTLETVIETMKDVEDIPVFSEPEKELKDPQCKRTLTKLSSDESDVVTPFEQDKHSSTDSDNTSRLLHSGEFHDMVLPTKVSRGDTSVVRGE